MTKRVIIIGGGLIGLATAHEMLKISPDVDLILLEKEDQLTTHQSGRNSGVLHSGIYYAPGSKKAENCIRGKALLESFCSENNIPHRVCGKIIVATNAKELSQLHKLSQRAAANGITATEISCEGIKEIEPYVSAIKGLFVPSTGVVDFRSVGKVLASKIKMNGGQINLGEKAEKISDETSCIKIESNKRSYTADMLVNCAGLYSDEICRLSGMEPKLRICPFRGEYFLLSPESSKYCKTLIYPVPDPRYPFLGVHLTRGVDDRVECGPNAVLALAREGYRWSDISVGETLSLLAYPGFRKFLSTHLQTGVAEIVRSFSKNRFLTSLRKLVPDLPAEALLPGPSGVRAQALTNDGNLLDDFYIEQRRNMLHVLNAPSPAATSCLAVGEHLAKLATANLLG